MAKKHQQKTNWKLEYKCMQEKYKQMFKAYKESQAELERLKREKEYKQ